MTQSTFDHQVAIIGSGFSGMAVAIALDRVGIHDYILLEKSDDIGGTWRDNQYPGACCDVPSQLYSFSFELNPDWSRRFSPAKEIHNYQQKVMDKYDLRKRTRTSFEVISATSNNGGWTVVGNDGEQLDVRYVVSAIGGLHIPNKPKLPGLQTFSGKVMHSAEWDHSYDVSGKNAIVIGSAASAVQIIPQLAKTARQLTVVQRTANYLISRRDRAISGVERSLFRKLPFIQRLFRWRQYCYLDFVVHANFLLKRGIRKYFAHHLVRRHLSQQVKDPDLARRLTPDYQIGCKRILLSDDFFPAMQADNVSLVTDAIDHFSATGLVTVDGLEIDADLVVLATGFQTSKLFGNMKIIGATGQTLQQAWDHQIRAHRSVAVQDFDNFFMVYGPNSGLGHSSIIIMIEAQARYLASLMKHAHDAGTPRISVKPKAEAAYNLSIQNDLKETVWNSDCKSWYKDASGHNFTLWPHTTTRFIHEMRHPVLDEYSFS